MNSEIVSFPGLGIEVAVRRVAFTIGNFPIYWYGILLATGLFCGMIYAFYNCKRVAVDSDKLVDVLMGAVIGGVVGARAYYVIFSWDQYKDNLLRIFDLRHGGIAIYGSIIGGILAGILICKWRKVRILPCLDLAGGALLLGQSIGRWGNFVNIEAFGSNTTSVFGMTSPAITRYLQQYQLSGGPGADTIDPNLPVHPTFLYESVWCLVGFLIMAFFIMKIRSFDGEAFLFYCAWYGAGRMVIEGLRTDSLMWGNIRVSQALAFVCVIVALGLWAAIRLRMKRQGIVSHRFVDTPEGQLIAAGASASKTSEPVANEPTQTSQEEPDSSCEEQPEGQEENNTGDKPDCDK